MNKAHTIKLYPTKSQDRFFRQSCGVARFSYNWALSIWKELYKNGQTPSAYLIIKIQNSVKKDKWPWMLDVGKCAPQYAIHNLERAYKKYFKKKSELPKYKKKGLSDSFVAVENKEQFKQINYRIWIPRLGWVKCAENLRFNGKVNYVNVNRVTNTWFATVNIDTYETPAICENQTVVGVDIGINKLAVTSDGLIFENKKPMKKMLRSINRNRRSLDRKIKWSANYKKQKNKLSKVYYKVKCIRKNNLHELTSYLVKNYGIVVIEDLNVSGMIKNRNLSSSITDVSFGEFRRQLQYKSEWNGVKLIIADRFYASSKTCNKCKHIHVSLTLRDRIFNCPNCGFACDRDLNASLNLADLGRTQKTWESQACGEGSSLVEIHDSPSLKQEVNSCLT